MEDSLELIENRVQRVSKSLKEMESFDNYPKFLGNNEELMTLLKTHLAPDIDDWILNIFQFGSRFDYFFAFRFHGVILRVEK